jgi:Uncharacterised nucleotidyltransferase
VPPAVRWMLLRAFGPPDAPFAEGVDPAEALAAARRFEVSPRVAVRQGRARLAAELGADAAAAFQRDLTTAAAQGLRIEALLRTVAAVAAERSIPLVLLKFAALTATGVLAPGARTACDLDLLAPAERAAELQEALLARGFRSSGLPDAEHQLPALVHPAGGVLELHRLVLGVRPGGGGSATLPELERSGLLAPAPGLPGCSLPAREVLMAHALVHGIGQHGFWPDSYPLLRTLADLIDLGFQGEAAELPAQRAVELVARDVAREEAEAVRDLCRALVEGKAPTDEHGPAQTDTDGRGVLASPCSSVFVGARPCSLLLRHILAGRLDADYAASLRLSLFREQPSDRPPVVRMVRTALSAVFLSRAQIDAIYGRPGHPLGYLGRRLARPFDLLRRLWIYSSRSLRVKL